MKEVRTENHSPLACRKIERLAALGKGKSKICVLLSYFGDFCSNLNVDVDANRTKLQIKVHTGFVLRSLTY